MKCVICGNTFLGFGNNAEPLSKGRCCDYCNEIHVIPARIEKMQDWRKQE